VVALLVLGTVAFAVPHDAWLPFAPGPATAASWESPPARALGLLAHAQVGTGAWIWPADRVVGAIAVAAILTAAGVAALLIALRHTGLRRTQAMLLATVAAAAPLACWQAGSPLGAAPVFFVATWMLALVVTRHSHRTGGASRLPGGVAATVAFAVLLVAELVTRAVDASTTHAMWMLLQAELGWQGLVLMAPALAGLISGRAGSNDTTSRALTKRVWVGLGAAVVVTTPMPALVRVAALAPWAWWLVAAGIGQLAAWRGTTAARWVTAGLLIWVGLHVTRVPWGHQRQQAALTRTWAEGVAAGIGTERPLVADGSARTTLIATLAGARPRADAAPIVISPEDAWAATRDGRYPLIASDDAVSTLRWSGLGFAAVDELGVPLERVLASLPRGTVTLVVIAAEASRRISPIQWQALGRLGLRLPDAGTARAHALVGITGARAEALEAAQPGSVRLDVQPGDPLGRTGTRAPVDARLTAGPTRVSVLLRGQPVVEADGVAVLLFSTRGQLLGWRAGSDPARLSGPALGRGPTVAAIGVAALPCRDLAPGSPSDVSSLTSMGALGVTWSASGRLNLTLTRPAVDVAAGASSTLSIGGSRGQASAVALGGPVVSATASVTRPARACAAWPVPFAIALGARPLDVRAAPADADHFGRGWHDPESDGPATWFRWMASTRADLFVALRQSTALTLTLDAQGPGQPGAGDNVQLAINGQEFAAQPVLPTRGLYSWSVPAAAVRAGLNVITIGTTRMVRPADQRAGADERRLGLLVRRVTVTAEGTHTNLDGRADPQRPR
jgi:hypothetical protein